jgi:hypothetical protein
MRAVGRSLANFAFLFALAVWGGMVVFFTFITTPIVFDTLDRDLAAQLLGQLFPRFFQLQLLCCAVALAFIAGRLILGAPPRGLALAATILLTVALAIGLYNTFIVQPEMAAAQARVGSFVTTPKEDPARVAYGQLHGRAMILNGLASLLGGTTLAIAAIDPRLLARRDERALATVTATPIETTAHPTQRRAADTAV